ncbi:MAG: glycerate kinase [Microcella pacifica]|uniref:glycerate kinase n=1 Tax=Microcella pacifica TaxID=2591847 RepID=UPI0033162052
MSVVIAPDSFKGTISAADAAAALAAGWLDERPADHIVLRPMADGGEGTIDAFALAVPGARRMPVTVTGADGSEVHATWLLLPPTDSSLGEIGVVELASTCGIELLGNRLLPLDAHTTGFGEAIAAALDYGVSQLVLGLGSSSSTDGGTGVLSALGARFTDAEDAPIPLGARGLETLASADLSRLRPLPAGGVNVLADVKNPLLGPKGATAVFGPQKGLGPEEIAIAEAGLARLASMLPCDANTVGAGAAGGVGFGLLSWGARIVPGAVAVADIIGLAAAVASGNIVLTGEGTYDGQSAAGKAPAHVVALAREKAVPVAVVAGRVAADADTSALVASLSLIDLAGSPQSAIANPARWLRDAGRQLAAEFGA